MKDADGIDNPELGQRIQTLTPGSNGWEIYFRARAMQDAGEQLTNLAIGEHDIRTDPSILNAMGRAANDGHTGYAAIPGTPSLRKAVATRVERQSGVPTGPENVLIVPGAQAGLFAAHMAALDPGDTALFVDPFYATYPGTIRAAGGRPQTVRAPAADGFRPDIVQLASLGPNARTLLINSPNNPTGIVYDADTLGAIAEVSSRDDLWLISDEVYEGQIASDVHLSPRSLPGMAKRTFVVSSMSKTYAMTGSRIGWVIGPERAIAELSNLSTHTNYGVPGFIQDAAEYALSLGPEFEAQIAAPFHRRRMIAQASVSRSAVVSAVMSDATMYVMLDVSPTRLTGLEFAEKLLSERKIAVMPGGSFGSEANDHVRVALTVPDEELGPAFDTVVRFIEELSSD